MHKEMSDLRSQWKLPIVRWCLVLFFSFYPLYAFAQRLEKALITHSSDSVTTAFLTYGIERGFYRKAGVDLEFRLLRGDLAINAMISTKEVDYVYGTPTVFLAAVQGAPVKVLANSFKGVIIYLMGQGWVQSPNDLKGKKIAVVSHSGLAAMSAKASLRALGLDLNRDMTIIVIGTPSIRMAAMESGSVAAAMMPVPWNFRMRQKGFKELIFAGKVMPAQPTQGIATSKEKIEKNPEQVRKVLGGFLETLKAVKREGKEFTGFMARRFSLESQVAEEVYKFTLEVLTEDGTIDEAALSEYLEQVKKEAGVKRAIALSDIVDYRLVREVAKGSER